jgi:FtsH-binding integral membrane protein
MKLRVSATLALALLLASPAALAASGETVGQNVGDLLKSWAAPIFTGVAAMVSLVFLLNRRYNELALFILAAVLVGGFVFAPMAVAQTIESIWRTITR